MTDADQKTAPGWPLGPGETFSLSWSSGNGNRHGISSPTLDDLRNQLEEHARQGIGIEVSVEGGPPVLISLDQWVPKRDDLEGWEAFIRAGGELGGQQIFVPPTPEKPPLFEIWIAADDKSAAERVGAYRAATFKEAASAAMQDHIEAGKAEAEHFDAAELTYASRAIVDSEEKAAAPIDAVLEAAELEPKA
jgi:hypothetical protein